MLLHDFGFKIVLRENSRQFVFWIDVSGFLPENEALKSVVTLILTAHAHSWITGLCLFSYFDFLTSESCLTTNLTLVKKLFSLSIQDSKIHIQAQKSRRQNFVLLLSTQAF